MKKIRKHLSPTPYAQLDPWVDESLPHWLQRKTYRRLRHLMEIVAISLPIIFWVSSFWDDVGMQGSISAFYHTPMRNVFVGAIFAMGMGLYAYKGYNYLENACLTAAGLFLFGVALAPTDAPLGIDNWELPVVHKVCSFAFFALIAAVCWFGRKHGLQSSGNAGNFCGLSFLSARKITAILMISVLVVAVLLFIADKVGGIKFSSSTFLIETAALLVFALYWQIVSSEMSSLE